MLMSKTAKKELKNSVKTFAQNDIILKINTIITSFVELQRIFSGTFLIIPKICKNKNNICIHSTSQFNIYYYQSYIIYSNLLMLLLFVIMYLSELRREYLLISYLYNDKYMPTDNNNISQIVSILPLKTQNKIRRSNIAYKIISCITIFYFIINTIANSYILYLFYSHPSLLIFITNTLFMGCKLTYVFAVINTEKFVLYSAYINQKYQFNDIMPIVLENIQIKLDNNQQSNHIEIEVSNL
jgi:hypothetical protein